MIMMNRIFTFGLLFLSSFSLFAQKEAYNWNFGFGLGLDFSSGQPVFTNGGNTYAAEGSASYSDKNGNLLFYTSGDTFIYNANNQVMFNMGNSGGNYSAMQSSVIIEAPCEPGMYYLFTMDGIDPTSSNNGLSYFKIDMSLNGGLGGVVQPGVSLFSNSLEGLCAIRARNKTDYFILINHNTIGLGVYKVTAAGVALQSVFNYPPFGTKRIIKASPDGTKVFVIPDPDGTSSPLSTNSGILLDFDNINGVLSNPQLLSSVLYSNPSASCNGFNYFEFSPNSRYLYVSTCNSVQRFDLLNGQTVANVIFDFFNWTASAGISQFQLGPDGNIYFCFFGQLLSSGQVVTELARIRCPNNALPVVERVLPVPNGNFFLAMPNFPAWLFEAYDSTYVSLGPDTVFLCDNNGFVSLDALNPGSSYQWSNGSTAQNITVNIPGTYTVTVNGPCGIGADTIVVLNCYDDIVANYFPCSLDSITFSLYSSSPFNSITWNFGDPGSGSTNVATGSNTVHTFSQDGTYTITALIITPCSVDTFSETISVYDAIPPILNIVACESYTSQSGVTYTQSGTYFEYVDSLTSECDSLIQVNLTITGLPSVSASSISGTCGQPNGTATATATGGSGNYAYTWSNGSAGSFISGLSAGSYTVVATDQNGCSATSQVVVSTSPAAGVTLLALDTIIGLNESVTLEIVGGNTYNWSPALGLNCTDCPSVIASPQSSTIYTVTGTDSIGCPYIRKINVIVDIVCNDLFIPDIFSPNGTGNPENDKFCAYSNCIRLFSFIIYNRWGEKVFETTDIAACWDGTYKGKESPSGIYAFKLYAEQIDGTIVDKKGTITLVR
jgi:gliding motility-associated-like protein